MIVPKTPDPEFDLLERVLRFVPGKKEGDGENNKAVPITIVCAVHLLGGKTLHFRLATVKRVIGHQWVSLRRTRKKLQTQFKKQLGKESLED